MVSTLGYGETWRWAMSHRHVSEGWPVRMIMCEAEAYPAADEPLDQSARCLNTLFDEFYRHCLLGTRQDAWGDVAGNLLDTEASSKCAPLIGQ